MFLIPALNIMFFKVIHIAYDLENCKATKKEEFQWLLERGGKNREVFNWISYHDIKTTEIPNLKKLLAAEEEKDEKAQDKKKISKLEEGIEGWESALMGTDELYEKAKDGEVVGLVGFSLPVSLCT
jgi:hypothetical protein